MNIDVTTSAGIHVTVSNPFPDQTEMIGTFVSELKDQLSGGPVLSEVKTTCTNLIKEDFMPVITGMATQCIKDSLSVDGVKLHLDMPEIPTICTSLDLPQIKSAQITIGQSQCVAMGSMSASTAQTQFVQSLVASVDSPVGNICIMGMLEKVVKEDLCSDIRKIAESSITMVNIPGLEITSLKDPPRMSFELPSYPDPIRVLDPCGYVPRTNASLEISATIDVDLSTFQSELFGPKFLECMDEVKDVVKESFNECKNEIIEKTTETFTKIIEVAVPPPPDESVIIITAGW